MARALIYAGRGGGTHPVATMIRWLVREGGRVSPGDALCQFEIDKAIETLHAETGGYVRRIAVRENERFAAGSTLAQVSESLDEELPDDRPVRVPFPADRFDWSEIDVRDGPPEPLDARRRAIADRMAMSKRFIPCFHLTGAVDMSACLALRARLKERGEKATFNDMIVRASALALARHPGVRGVFVPEGFQPRARVNVGFAAALPGDGLVVPVVKDADKKRLIDVAAETRELAARARRGELRPEDCAGGIFSVSYLGMFEVDEFAAIVNPGEAAILAAGRPRDQATVVDGRIRIAPLMRITLSSDHRSIDGAQAARFIGEVKRFLERPDPL